jgi:hypothetical protein
MSTGEWVHGDFEHADLRIMGHVIDLVNKYCDALQCATPHLESDTEKRTAQWFLALSSRWLERNIPKVERERQRRRRCVS